MSLKRTSQDADLPRRRSTRGKVAYKEESDIASDCDRIKEEGDQFEIREEKKPTLPKRRVAARPKNDAAKKEKPKRNTVKKSESDQDSVLEEEPPKRQRTPRKATKMRDSNDEAQAEAEEETRPKRQTSPKKPQDIAAKKLKQLTSFITSPFPEFGHPTPQECETVVKLLSKVHGPSTRPKERPKEGQKEGYGAACGAVPSVLDALVRTILSQNTTSKNSTAAKRNLDEKYGKFNWKAIHEAPIEEVTDALRVGGLAPSKTQTIRNVLATAYQKYGEFSLDHLHDLSDDEAMREMISFKGVGPKTASCVLLFCMHRDSFAVDTHVYRLSKSLGWVPPRATREETYGHLDLKIPGEFKYPLHVLLIKHGKSCGRCAAKGRSGLSDAKECPLKEISKTKAEKGEKVEPEEEEEEGDDDDNYDVAKKGVKKGDKKGVKKGVKKGEKKGFKEEETNGVKDEGIPDDIKVMIQKAEVED